MTFIYKCRLCGKLSKSLHIGDNSEESKGLAVHHLCCAIHDNPQEIMGPRMTNIHTCDKFRTGISDLIGCEPDET